MDPTDVSAISQANVQMQVQMALARKAMDIQKQQGQQLAQLLEMPLNLRPQHKSRARARRSTCRRKRQRRGYVSRRPA